MPESISTLEPDGAHGTATTSLAPHVVRIELLRVQTFLFAVPRLRHMVGANVLLGEVMRRALPALAIRCCASADVGYGNWVDAFPELPRGSNQDPLAAARWSSDRDEPRRIASRGVLIRDGGHFAALFPSKAQALRFQELAEAMIQRELPGLLFAVSCIDLDDPRDSDIKHKEPRLAHRRVLVDLPIFKVCRFTGRNPAAQVAKARSGEEPQPISRLALRLKRRGDAFFGQDRARRPKDSTRDIIGLLRDELPNRELDPPEDLGDLCGPDSSGRRDYLAVVHADGNRVGLRYAQFRDRYRGKEIADTNASTDPARTSCRGGEYLSREGFGESFYYGMRVAVRRAVVAALSETFGEFKGAYRPFQLLMLGGDDLLLLCRARYALEFLVAYAQGLQCSALPGTDAKEKHPLSIGAGVVIARPSVPFHRLHALAEDLAGSAKRLDRATSSTQGPGVSVVDWMVFSESWSDEVASVRQRDAQVCYRRKDGNEEWLGLTGRPYRILRPDHGSADSLEALMDDVKQLPGAARSQLRQIALDLRKGRLWAELRWQELPEDTRSALRRAGVDTPWRRLEQRSINGRTVHGFLSRLADLVELYEFAYLGRKETGGNAAVAARGGRDG